MKITLLGSDLSANETGRLYLLGNVLKRRYEVEVVGLSACQRGGGIWSPVNTGELVFKPVPCAYRYTDVLWAAKKVLQSIEGDVVYVEGLKGTSYGIALWYKLNRHKPMVLDTGDWELGHLWSESRLQRCRAIVGQLFQPNGYPVLLLMEKLAGLADAVTGSNRFVVERHRGVFVPHGKNTEIFDPALYDRAALRREWAVDWCKLIVYFGTPRRHKGLEQLMEAIGLLGRPEVRLMLVGITENSLNVERLQNLGGEFTIFVGRRPFSDVPRFLSMADLIVIPQQDTPSTKGQMPAKLYDAMAMARPIVATPVSDIPEALDGCGYLARSGEPENLADAMLYVLEHPQEGWELGRKARQRCIEKYSWDAMERTLVGIFDQFQN